MSSLPSPSYRMRLGPAPMITTASTSPNRTFHLCDSATIIELNKSFPDVGNKNSLMNRKRLNSGEVVVFATPPFESQVLDHAKEAAKLHNKTKGPNVRKKYEADLRGWESIGMGIGICKEHDAMKVGTFARQTFKLDGADIDKYIMESEEADIEPDKVQSATSSTTSKPRLPFTNWTREEARIEMFRRCAILIRSQYPNAVIVFWIGSLSLVDYLGKFPTKRYGLEQYGTLQLGKAIHHIANHLINTLPAVNDNLVTPLPHPYCTEHKFAFDDLVFPPGSKTFRMVPPCQPTPPHPIGALLQSLPNHRTRILADTNAFSHSHSELEAFAKQVDPSSAIQIAFADEVLRELPLGLNPQGRMNALGRIRAAISNHHYTLIDTPTRNMTAYRPDAPPVIRTPSGDLLLRQQIVEILRILDKNRGTDKLLVIWITQDLGCQALMETIESPSPDCVFVSSFQHQREGYLARSSLIQVMKGVSV